MSISNSKRNKKLIAHVTLATSFFVLAGKYSAIAAYIGGGGCADFSAICDRVEFELDGRLFRADFVEGSFKSLNSKSPNPFPFIANFATTQEAQTSIINELNSAVPIPTDLAVANFSGQTHRSSNFAFPLRIPEPGAVLNEGISYGYPPGISPENPIIPKRWTESVARPTGEDTVSIYPLIKEVPEPLTLLGSVAVLGGGILLKKRYRKWLIRKKV